MDTSENFSQLDSDPAAAASLALSAFDDFQHNYAEMTRRARNRRFPRAQPV